MFINHYSQDKLVTKQGERICPNCMRAMTNEHPKFFGDWICVYCERLGTAPQSDSPQEITKIGAITIPSNLCDLSDKDIYQLAIMDINGTDADPKFEFLRRTEIAVRWQAQLKLIYANAMRTVKTIKANRNNPFYQNEELGTKLANAEKWQHKIIPRITESNSIVRQLNIAKAGVVVTAQKSNTANTKLDTQIAHAKRMSDERTFYRAGLYELERAISAGQLDPEFLLKLISIRLDAKPEDIQRFFERNHQNEK